MMKNNLQSIVDDTSSTNEVKQKQLRQLLVHYNNRILVQFMDSVRYDLKKDVFVLTTLTGKQYWFKLAISEVITVKSGNQNLVVEQLKLDELKAWFTQFLMAVHGDDSKYSITQFKLLFEKKVGI